MTRRSLARHTVLGVVLAALVTGAMASCSEDGGAVAPTSGSQLGPGDSAPRFTLPDARGGDLSLELSLAKGPALMYFSMGPG